MPKCDTIIEDALVSETPLAVGITFHRLGLIVAAITGLIAIGVAEYLIFQHARHYLKPWEQKHIIRILFMIPVYAAVSFLSYFYYKHAIYYQVLRDCYEAFAIASFFTLLCNYIAPSLHDQKDFFRASTPKNWIWPISWIQKCTGGQNKGFLRKPASGLTGFNIIYVCVFQYCFIRVFFTVVSVLAQVTNRYCESSLSPAFAHIWVLVFEGASVTVAMYGLLQFYAQLKTELAPHKPFLKLLCIKLVIFFCFWQNLVISFLSSANGPLHPTKYLDWPDINVGLPSVLVTCEMMIFSFLHIFAFPWRKPYGQPHPHTTEAESVNAPGSGFSGKELRYQGGFMGWKAIADAFNPWDIIKASARGFRWLFVGARRRREDISYSQPGGNGFDNATSRGGGGGEAMYGYAPPPQQGGYDSMKLQPITGSYSMAPGTPSNTGYQSTAYSGAYQQPGASAASTNLDRPPNRTDDPWRSDISIDAYGRPRGNDGSRVSGSPSPAPHNRVMYDARHEDDRAGLLHHADQQPSAGYPNAGANTGYQASPDPGTGYHGSTLPSQQWGAPVPAPAPNHAAAYGQSSNSRGMNVHNDYDDDDDDDDNNDDDDERYRGPYSPGSIGVATTTDNSTAFYQHQYQQQSQQQQRQRRQQEEDQLGIHPAFRKEVELERQYQGYGRTSWGNN